ncbi:MAG: adenylyl-sulfate kinase [Bacteroidetes bacterium]|nr:adenylyl-sulfate kinase [Bacteroidota bacterium]
MAKQNQLLYPEPSKTISREEKEAFLKQRAKVIWLTGLSGSGKTTIGTLLEKELFHRHYLTEVLDGDNVRTGINNNLTFSVEDRNENIRRIAETAKLFLNSGIIVISCFISPTNYIRAMAKKIIGEEDFIEVYINAPFDICEERDVKGLYKKARKGELKDFTGIDSPFDNPVKPDIEIRTDLLNIKESVEKLLFFILPMIENKPRHK